MAIRVTKISRTKNSGKKGNKSARTRKIARRKK